MKPIKSSTGPEVTERKRERERERETERVGEFI
jgi:hypothetical protein